MHPDVEFLKSNGDAAMSVDRARVLRCLKHRKNDVRHLALSIVCRKHGAKYVDDVIRLIATHPAWKTDAYGAARKILPLVSRKQGQVLIECFDSLVVHDETAYMFLCMGCPSRELASFLKSVIQNDHSEQRTHLAMGALHAVPEGANTSYWRSCMHHPHKLVRHCARAYIEIL